MSRTPRPRGDNFKIEKIYNVSSNDNQLFYWYELFSQMSDVAHEPLVQTPIVNYAEQDWTLKVWCWM